MAIGSFFRSILLFLSLVSVAATSSASSLSGGEEQDGRQTAISARIGHIGGTTLIMRGKNINGAEAAAFAEFLTRHPGVDNCSLTRNRIFSGGATLGAALRDAPTVTKWVFAWNEMDTRTAMDCAAALAGNRTLTHLEWAGNDSCDRVVETLATALGQTNLEELNLNANRIGPVGAQALSDLLKVTGTVRKLRLNWNKIGDQGGEALAGALMKEGMPLTILHLRGCGIGDRGASALAHALTLNGGITALDLGLNHPITQTTKERLKEQLGHRILF